jgi:hypothetical protein
LPAQAQRDKAACILDEPVNQTARTHVARAWILASLLLSSHAGAEQIGRYSVRSLTLGSGTVRVDGGPPDWGYFHPGGPQWINENRGLRVRVDNNADRTWAWLGLGLGVGVTDDVELGGLLLPIRVTPDSDIDDLEVYGRFGLLEGTFEMAGQATVQLPAETDPGLGLGLPMLVHAGNALRIDTGVEIEMLFWDDTVVSLDLPLAFTWDLGRVGFLGMRTGMYFRDMDALVVPAGIHGGGVLANGHVDIAGWFTWPGFLATEREDALEVNSFEFGFGVNARID